MSYYHYTKGCHLRKIIIDGKILTTKVMSHKNVRPAVWLTKSPKWDSACNIGILKNVDDFEVGKIYSSKYANFITATDEYMKKEIGMCRIVISETVPTTSWAEFRYVCNISSTYYFNLEKSFREKGSPTDLWLCSFSPIPSKYWEGIEIFVGNEWVRWDEKISIVRFLELCMSCNGNNEFDTTEINLEYPGHYFKEHNFFMMYEKEIIGFWEANKHKKGYIQIYIKPNYEPYDCGFQFIEKRFEKSKFVNLDESKSNNYVLVHLLWEDTRTQYKVSLAYEPESGLVMLHK